MQFKDRRKRNENSNRFKDCVFDLRNGEKYANLENIGDQYSNLKNLLNQFKSEYGIDNVIKQFPDAVWGDTKRINKRTGKEVNIIDNSQVSVCANIVVALVDMQPL